MQVSRVILASAGVPLLTSAIAFQPELSVILTSGISIMGMKDFFQLRSLLLGKYKDGSIGVSKEAAPVASASSAPTEIDEDVSIVGERIVSDKTQVGQLIEEDVALSMKDYAGFQMLLRCVFCWMYSMIGFYSYLTRTMTPEWLLWNYAVGTVMLSSIMFAGTVFGFFNSGLESFESRDALRKNASLDLFAFAADLFGMFFIGGGAGFLFLTAMISKWWVLFFLLSMMVSDSACTIFGNILLPTDQGKNTISSNKSVYGVLLSSLLTGGFAALFRFLLMTSYKSGFIGTEFYMMNQPWNFYIAFGAIFSLLGFIGDFGISFIKRVAGLKGRGGWFADSADMLGMFDSTLFAAPFAFYTSLLLQQ